MVEGDFTKNTASDFRVITVSPEASVLGSLAMTGPVVKAVLRGNTVYLAKDSNGIELVNIEKPSAPSSVWQGNLGNTVDVGFVNNFVVLANGNEGLITAELQADASLIERKSIKLPDPNPPLPPDLEDPADAISLQVVDNKVYVGASIGIFIVEINDAGEMSIQKHYKTSYPVNSITVVGDYLYVTTRNNNEGALATRILRQNSQTIPNVAFEANQLLVNGAIAYASSEYYGITLFDVSNPLTPQTLFESLTRPVRHLLAVNDVLLIVGATDLTKTGDRYTGKGVLSIVASLSSLPP
jgi:hypothetical protein